MHSRDVQIILPSWRMKNSSSPSGDNRISSSHMQQMYFMSPEKRCYAVKHGNINITCADARILLRGMHLYCRCCCTHHPETPQATKAIVTRKMAGSSGLLNRSQMTCFAHDRI